MAITVQLVDNYKITVDSVNENQDVLGKTKFLMINVPFSDKIDEIKGKITAENMGKVTVNKDGTQIVFEKYTDAIFLNTNISGQGLVLTINAQAQKKT